MTDKFLKMLESPEASARYEACEELRVATALTDADGVCEVNPSRTANAVGVFQANICQDGRYALFGPTHAIGLPVVIYGSDVRYFPPP